MRLTAIVPGLAAALFGWAAVVYAADEAIPVNTGNAQAGDGHAVMFKGSPLPLTGAAIKVGDTDASGDADRRRPGPREHRGQ